MKPDFLTTLGLGENEARLYVALLELGEGTVDEIVKIAGIRRPSAYKALRSLLDKGLVAEVASRPLRYRILPPEEALDELYRRRLDEVARLYEALPKSYESFLREAQRAYAKARSRVDLGRDIVILRGAKAVVDIVTRLGSQVRDCVRMTARAPVLGEDDAQVVEGEFEAVGFPQVKQGVKLKMIVESDILKVPGFIELARSTRFGEKVIRHIPRVPMELAIYDDFAAVLELHGENESDLERCKMVYVQNRHLVELLILAFDALWERAEPIAEG